MINFFENINSEAELLPLERKELYTFVSNKKPKIIFEVGTGSGGGSTYFICRAIQDHLIDSKVYTCDPSRSPSHLFLESFPFLKYFKNYSSDIIDYLVNNNIKPNFLMFDGPENPSVALNDIKKLEPFIDDGTFLCIHDYETQKRGFDGATSTKAALIRPYLEQSKNWTKLVYLSGLEKNSNFDDWKYDSVGFVIFEYKK
jgi:hypothetical protein